MAALCKMASLKPGNSEAAETTCSVNSNKAD